MRDPEDARQVRIQLQSTLSISLQSADIAVNSINAYMAMLKAQAPLAEATKARDSMIAIREQLRAIKTQ